MLIFPQASNAADWSEHVDVVNEGDGETFPLAGHFIEIELRDQRGCRQLYGSTNDGSVVIDAQGFSFRFSAAVMRGLRPATYQVHGRIETPAPNKTIVQIIDANILISDGGFQ